MAKLPTDLSKKFWNDNKPKKLKSAEFDDALAEHNDLLATLSERKQADDALVNRLIASCKRLQKTREDAEKACLPLLHDDAKKILKKYESLISNEQTRMDKLKDDCNRRLNELVGATSKMTTAAITKYNSKLSELEAGFEKIEAKCKTLKDDVDESKVHSILKLLSHASTSSDDVVQELKNTQLEMLAQVDKFGLSQSGFINANGLTEFKSFLEKNGDRAISLSVKCKELSEQLKERFQKQ